MNEEIMETMEETNPSELDDIFEEAEPAEEETNPEPENPQQEEPEQPVYTLKHLGQEVQMGLDDLIMNAQKGLDYDHVRQEYDRMRNAPEFQILDRYAQQAGMTREQYVQELMRQEQEARVQQEVGRGVPEDVARRLLQLEQDKRQREAMEAQQRRQQEQRQAFVELAREYPGIKEFPPEVIQAVAKGEKPLSAYRAWENKQLRQKIVRLSILQFRDLDQSLDTVGALSVVVHGWGKAKIPFAVDDM